MPSDNAVFSNSFNWDFNLHAIKFTWGFPGGASGKAPTCQCRRHKETLVLFLGWEDPLEEEMVIHSSILLAWLIPWTEEPSRSQSMAPQGCKRVRQDWETIKFTFFWSGLKWPKSSFRFFVTSYEKKTQMDFLTNPIKFSSIYYIDRAMYPSSLPLSIFWTFGHPS